MWIVVVGHMELSLKWEIVGCEQNFALIAEMIRSLHSIDGVGLLRKSVQTCSKADNNAC